MKVAYLSKTFKHGGAASGNLAVIKALKLAKLELDIYSSDQDSPLKNLFRKIERIFDHIIFGADSHFAKFYAESHSEIEFLRSYDLVQLGDVSGNLIPLEKLRSLNVPIVHRVSDMYPYAGSHHYFPEKKGSIESLLNEKIFTENFLFSPNKIIAPSKWIRDRILIYRPDLADKFEIIPNAGVQEEVSLKKKNKKKHIRLGFISFNIFEERKGLRQLIKEVGKIKKNNKDIEIEIMVFGEGKPVIRQRFISYFGKFKKENLADIFSMFDILMVPSLFDNSPNVIIEAYQNNTPVIVQKDTGASEYVKVSSTGFLYDFWSDLSNPNKLLEHIDEIKNAENHFQRNCISYYDINFRPSVIGTKYLNIYQELSNGYKY